MDVNQRSAQMVPPPTNTRWGHAEGWPQPSGTGLEQILAGRALAHMGLRLSQSYPRNSQRTHIDQR